MRLDGTSTRVPVLGLRPTRGSRCRVRKLPNPRISILSPPLRERTMLSKIASTITSESLRVISTTRETSSINSAFVILCFISLVRSVLTAFSLYSDIHYFFDGHGGSGGVALVILQPGFLLVVGQRANAETDFLFAFVQLHDLEIQLFTNRQGRFLSAAIRGSGDLGAMAQAFHAGRQLHENPKIAGAAHSPAHHVAHLMSAEE